MVDPYIGQINPIAFTYAPYGWAECNGTILTVASNQALYALIGDTFGGDGRTNFALPDLRGRVIVGEGQGTGLSYYAHGAKGGFESVTLAETNMPSHTHAVTSSGSVTIKASSAVGTSAAPGGKSNTTTLGALSTGLMYNTETPSVALNIGDSGITMQIGNAGGGQAHSNIQPFLALKYCIALQGAFPPRN